jgi:hypothetical protein
MPCIQPPGSSGARRPDGEHGRKRSYSPVPPSASFALKGNCFSSKAKSRSEIAKAARSIGAASGLFRSRFLSQSRIATRSSRNAALTNARKNLSRCNGLSRSQATVVASTKSMRRIFAFPLKSGSGKRNHENKYPKYSQGSRSRGPPGSSRPRKDPATDHRGRLPQATGGPTTVVAASATSKLSAAIIAPLQRHDGRQQAARTGSGNRDNGQPPQCVKVNNSLARNHNARRSLPYGERGTRAHSHEFFGQTWQNYQRKCRRASPRS